MANIENDELDNKVGETSRISREKEQNDLFVAMRDDGDLHGRMETSASAAAKAANPDSSAKGKKDKKKDDLAIHLMLLNDQIKAMEANANWLREQINRLNEQIEARQELINTGTELLDLQESGELDPNNPEHVAKLRKLEIDPEEYKEDPSILQRRMDALNGDQQRDIDTRNGYEKDLDKQEQDIASSREKLERADRTGDIDLAVQATREAKNINDARRAVEQGEVSNIIEVAVKEEIAEINDEGNTTNVNTDMEFSFLGDIGPGKTTSFSDTNVPVETELSTINMGEAFTVAVQSEQTRELAVNNILDNEQKIELETSKPVGMG